MLFFLKHGYRVIAHDRRGHGRSTQVIVTRAMEKAQEAVRITSNAAATAETRPDLVGPVMLAGSPLSYWAGVHGNAPMRYTGGLLGGTWLTALSGDLGNGRFDGAYRASSASASSKAEVSGRISEALTIDTSNPLVGVRPVAVRRTHRNRSLPALA